MRVILTSITAALALAGSALAAPAEYVIDKTHLGVSFKASHVGFSDVFGLFLRSDGSFTYDEETKTLSRAEFTVDAASVFTNLDARDKHLRNKDFLNVETHPTITFVMTSAKATSDVAGTVTGDLTMLGVTKPITVDAVLNKTGKSPFGGKHTLGITIEAVVKRSDWGMSYGAAQGFIGDEIPVTISFEAVRQE